MRKIKNYQVAVLLTTILLVSVFHACVKKEEAAAPTTDCKDCYAYKNSVQVAYQKACTASQEAEFKSAHSDATCTCY